VTYLCICWCNMAWNYTRIPEDYETLWFWLCLFRQPAASWI